MLELFNQGGPFMWPIGVCSVIALAIFLERVYVYLRISRGSDLLLREIEQLVSLKKTEEAVIVCQRAGTPLARIFIAALRVAGRDRGQIKTLVEEAGNRESAPLARYLGLMATIANISPLLGLLGTVWGMIQAFNVIAAQGVGTPATLGGGISQALITTAAGLTVAIPTILGHRYLSGRAERITLEMEEYSLHLVDLLGNK
ncbi:biopolymer transport protein ExbB [Geoalkalibacter ferrihydriticus]|uniref:Flagellar motor protein MotA n=2 Tax=Geoalkalibacter ferrihydriticus TaxID=392333 RepID=A0A0C2HFT5_9BACT|nr:MotA/TolQ/ExbB proton channel family protein [Geoalkalibacter ferrihydriticus]KIH75781.1 flagellar motor protein MotA [Geoalkalibacter ferrihydriticus DSM 17813]SDM64766.1 biopolymer transport protein ExbB [Geoalkalibacter ferrihydriticus]